MDRKSLLAATLAASLLATWLPAAARAQETGTAGKKAEPAADLELLRGMAELDRALIPALWLTRRGAHREAETAVGNLAQDWKSFRHRYGKTPPLAAAGRRLREVTEKISGARSTVFGTGDLRKAHEILEGVRHDLEQLRRDQGLSYFPDALTAFHEPLETILLSARTEEGETLSAGAVDRIRAELPRARERWAEVEATPVDNRVFGFPALALEEIGQRVDAEREALAALAAAVDGPSPDPAAVARAARGIGPPFERLYLLFGGIEPGGSRPGGE